MFSGGGEEGKFSCGKDVMEIYVYCSCFDCRIAWREEVVPREGGWGWEGVNHYSCEEGPWEAFEFNLGWVGDEEDGSVRGGVEKSANVWAEVRGRLCVARVIVEDAVEEEGGVGIACGNVDSQSEVASL